MATAIYSPLRRSFTLRRTRTWLASDHLLVISDRFFRENYSRIYWIDVHAVLLYSIPHPRGFMLAFEILCMVTAQVSASIMNIVWGSAFAALFVFAYASWRLMQPSWACQISTRLSSHRFPLGATRNTATRIIEDLKSRVRSVQESVAEIESPRETFVGDPFGAERESPTVAMHVIAFVLGLLTPLSSVVLLLYYCALIAAFFFQRDFQFPVAVRSAALMSQLLALFQIVSFFWFRFEPASSGYCTFPLAWEFHILTLLFSVFGIAAAYQESLQSFGYQSKNPSVLGLS